MRQPPLKLPGNTVLYYLPPDLLRRRLIADEIPEVHII